MQVFNEEDFCNLVGFDQDTGMMDPSEVSDYLCIPYTTIQEVFNRNNERFLSSNMIIMSDGEVFAFDGYKDMVSMLEDSAVINDHINIANVVIDATDIVFKICKNVVFAPTEAPAGVSDVNIEPCAILNEKLEYSVYDSPYSAARYISETDGMGSRYFYCDHTFYRVFIETFMKLNMSEATGTTHINRILLEHDEMYI